MANRLDTIKGGIQSALPIVLGYLPIGFAAGVVCGQAGLSILETALLSLLLYAGSAQFIFATLIGTGAGAATIFLTIFLVNLRHFLYSTVLSQKLKTVPRRWRVLIGAQLTDETFAISSTLQQQNFTVARGLIALNNTSYFSWFIGTTAGVIVNQQNFMENLGAEFLLVTMFAALIMLTINGSSQKRQLLAVLVLSVVLIVGLELWFSNFLNIIIATLAAAGIATLLFDDGSAIDDGTTN